MSAAQSVYYGVYIKYITHISIYNSDYVYMYRVFSSKPRAADTPSSSHVTRIIFRSKHRVYNTHSYRIILNTRARCFHYRLRIGVAPTLEEII